MKKILLICNEVNNFFSLSRHLRDNGFDAYLYLMKEETTHFSPEADSFDDDHKHYVHSSGFSRLPSGFFYFPKKNIEEIILGFDFIIGCGLAPAYLNKVGRRLDLFIPYGSDLDYQPYFNKKRYFNKKIFKILYMTYHQKMGIKNAKFVMMSKTNENFFSYYQRLGHTGRLIENIVPLIYDKQYSQSRIKKYINNSSSHFLRQMTSIRNSSQFIVFHHCRHEWDNQDSINYKGNEKLIKGFKSFIDRTECIDASLIMFENGNDKKKSKGLIEKLNILDNVHWFPVTERKEIMCGISLSDVGVGELGELSWLTYSTVCEFMCMSKPIIMFRDDDLYLDDFESLYPIHNASTVEQVSEALTKLFNDKSSADQMGMESKKWFNKYVIDKGLKEIINAIESSQ